MASQEKVPADLDVHLVMDNYSAHKSTEVQRWLKPKNRRRFQFHFTPPAVPGSIRWSAFFALITDRMIRPGTFHSACELETAIYAWLATWNGDPTPFPWKASAEVILDKVQRGKELAVTGD